jgi:hypothetical protein|tara:strand:+ start:1394 stop:2392 length:999 start_codon:yes stop_codon:yes gene_type:complete
MNDDLIKYIKLFLADGVINKKEKEIIFRKSKDLGIPQDECQMILDSFVFEAKAEKQNPDENKIIKTVKVFEQRKVKRIKPALLNQEVTLKEEIDKSNKLINKLIDESKEPMSKLSDLDTQISKKNEALQNLISHINDLENQLDKSTDLFFNKFKDEIFARFQSVPLYHNEHKMSGKDFKAAKSKLSAEILFRSKLNSNQYKEEVSKYFLENFGYDNTVEKKKLRKKRNISIIFIVFFSGIFIFGDEIEHFGWVWLFALISTCFATHYNKNLKSGKVHFNTDDINKSLNSVEKSYDYSKVELLIKCRELIKDSKQTIKKSTQHEDFIKKFNIK